MMKFREVGEILLLFAAFFLIMPYIPSHEGYVHEFGGVQLVAVALFGVSRAMRWKAQWYFVAAEVGLFALFVFVLQMSYNKL